VPADAEHGHSACTGREGGIAFVQASSGRRAVVSLGHGEVSGWIKLALRHRSLTSPSTGYCDSSPRPKTSSMISAPVVITGRSSRRYTTSVVRVEA
jgi:hypothetical protein